MNIDKAIKMMKMIKLLYSEKKSRVYDIINDHSEGIDTYSNDI